MRTILGLGGSGKEESQREVMRPTIAIAAGMSPVGGMEEAPVPCPEPYSPEATAQDDSQSTQEGARSDPESGSDPGQCRRRGDSAGGG